MGRLPANVNITVDRFLTGVTLPFTKQTLAPDQEQVLSMTWVPQDGGEIRSQIEFSVEGSTQPAVVLPLSATVVTPQLQLLETRGGVARRIDFGTLLYGEARSQEFEVR